MAKQDVRVELFHSGVWNNITDRVFVEDQITITRGRSDEGQQLKPATAGLTLDNTGGRFSPRNPRSPLFGLIGRNTPIRISTGEPHPAATHFATTDTTAHAAPSVEVPAVTNGVLLCCWAAPQNDTWTLPPSMTALTQQIGTQSIQSAVETIVGGGGGPTGTRTATFGVSEDYMAASVLILGSSLAIGEVEGDSNKSMSLNSGTPGNWVILFSSWWTDDTVDQFADIPDYPTSDRQDGWILLGDTGTVDIGDAEAQAMRLKVWAMQVKVTGPQTITLGGSDIARTLMHEVSGDIRDWSPRFVGEVSSWPPQWNIPGTVVRTPIQAAGITRRLGRAQTTLRPALTRAAPRDPAVVAHWPLADLGQDVEEAPSSIQGAPPVRARPTSSGNKEFSILWSADARAPGLGACPTVRGEQSGVGFTGTLPFGSTEPFGWSMWGRADGDDMASQFTMWVDTTTVSWLLWVLWETPSLDVIRTIIQVRDLDDNLVADLTNTTDAVFDDRWHNVAAVVAQSGANADLTVLFDGVEIPMSLVSGSLAGLTVGTPQQTRPTGTITAPAGRGMSIGHPTVLTGATTSDVVAAVERLYVAGRGHEGERPSARFDRILTEEGIPHAIVGNRDDEEVLLGPQFPGKLVELLREIGAAGMGWLYEARSFRGYIYRTVGSGYNQSPALELDYATNEVAPPLRPTDDDKDTVNDVTAQRRGGGEVRRVREVGPMNVNDPADDPQGIGRYDTNVTLNVAATRTLANQLQWLLHLGTTDEARYPKITVDLDAPPQLADAAAAVDVGDRLTIVNPPDDPDVGLPPETITQLVVGYTEPIGSHWRKITFNCVPESPYHIAEVEHPDFGIIGGGGAAVLGEDLTETETDVGIALGASPDFVHEVDFDILVAGERMTVTAVTAATGTFPNRVQFFTVIRSVNGIVKAHPVTPQPSVDVFHKSYIGL